MANIDEELLDDLQELRTQTREFFDEQKLTVRIIINVQTNETTTRLLAYQYYGSSELGESLAQLNSILDVSNVKGSIDILTE